MPAAELSGESQSITMYTQASPIVLASASPRRKLLLEELGITFECLPADIDEAVLTNEHPKDLASRLAMSKANIVATRHSDRFVLGADTDVELDGEILGKPKDHKDACRILAKIAGRTHTVWGGCALVNISRGVANVVVSSTKVTMLPISSSLIERYVATGEPMDKAGAYAVQGIGSQFISHITGSYPNVVGLDTPRVIELLKKYGVIN